MLSGDEKSGLQIQVQSTSRSGEGTFPCSRVWGSPAPPHIRSPGGRWCRQYSTTQISWWAAASQGIKTSRLQPMPGLIRAVGREIPGCSAAGGYRHPGAAAAGPRWHLHSPQGLFQESQLHLRVLDGFGGDRAGAGPEIHFLLLWVHVDVVCAWLHVLVVPGGARPVALPREEQGRVIEVFW